MSFLDLIFGSSETSELEAYLKSKNATDDDVHFWIGQFEEQKRLINSLTLQGNVVMANYIRDNM